MPHDLKGKEIDAFIETFHLRPTNTDEMSGHTYIFDIQITINRTNSLNGEKCLHMFNISLLDALSRY